MAVFVRILPAAALLVATAASLGAQQAAAPACDATQPSGTTALKANLTLNQALKSQQAKSDPAGIAKNLTSTVKTLEGDKSGDAGSAYILGSALALWMNQPGIGLTPKRSAVGFSTNPEATIDLPGAIDSLFKIVETKQPSCAYYTAYWRGGQQAYLDLVNGAINALNADKLDSAQFLATQANKLYSASPYGTMVLGNIASKKGNNDEAVKYWQEAATAAASDTSYRDVERQVLGNVANVYLNKARDNATPKAQQVEAAKKAAETYNKILAIPGGKAQAGTRQNLQAALLIAGDTASATKSYGELLANPSAYDYQDLLNAAVTASRANKTEDAAKLFEAALQANPYNRDALFNLAVTYLSLGQNDKVPPVVTRLVAVDPGNPENYLLAARAYVDIAKTRKGAAATTAVNDTTMTWFNRGSQLPVEVTFTEMSPGEKSVEIAGRVLDRRDKAAAAAAGSTSTTRGAAGAKKAAAPAKAALPPKAVTLKFEALDKAGAVLGSQSVTIDPLTPGKSAPFRVSIPAANAIAYRYTIAD